MVLGGNNRITQAPGGQGVGSTGISAASLAFLVVSSLIAIAISAIHLFYPINIVSYDRDVWHHTAVLNALLESPFKAVNPHVVSDIPSRTYMPWYVALALLGRSFGLTAQQLLGLSASLSMVTLMVGIWLFARTYYGHRSAPLVLLLVTFGTWVGGFNHTGYHTLSTMAFSASYPFAIVFAGGYVAWWFVLKALQSPGIPFRTLAAIVLASAFMFATHQLQAAFAIGGMLSFGLLHGVHSYARRGLILISILGGLLLSSFWPYYNPLGYAAVGGFYTIPFQSPFDWTDPNVVLMILGLSLLGVGGLYNVSQKRWRLDLLFGIGGIIAGLIVLYLVGSWMVLRFLPFLVVFLQLSTVAFLLDWPYRNQNGLKRLLQPLLSSAVVVLFLLNVGMASSWSWRAVRYLHGENAAGSPSWSRNINETAAAVHAIVGDNRVVVADWTTAYPIQAHHMKVVSIPYHFPEVPDSTIRQEASKAFFAAGTDVARRCAILRNYKVAAIVYRRARVPADVQSTINAFGERVDVDELTIVRLPASGPTLCQTP